MNLAYGGMIYPFVANYYGGTGNDLVLEWANNRIVSWGYNNYGQLGNGTTTNSSTAVAVDHERRARGKTVIRTATGTSHSLALCADGTLAAWGYNLYLQLGNGATSESSVPVLVDRTDVLAGKTVVAIAAGGKHNLALCDDGSLVAWGNNNDGQLGSGTTINGIGSLPVMVDRSGALADKSSSRWPRDTATAWHCAGMEPLAAWGSTAKANWATAGAQAAACRFWWTRRACSRQDGHRDRRRWKPFAGALFGRHPGRMGI